MNLSFLKGSSPIKESFDEIREEKKREDYYSKGDGQENLWEISNTTDKRKEIENKEIIKIKVGKKDLNSDYIKNKIIPNIETGKKNAEKTKNKSKEKEIKKDFINKQSIKKEKIKEVAKINKEQNKKKRNNNNLEEEKREIIEKEEKKEILYEENKFKAKITNEKLKNYENSKISVDFSKEKVIDFLKNRLNLDSKKLSKLNEEEIDGEALILLGDEEFKNLGFLIILKLRDKFWN